MKLVNVEVWGGVQNRVYHRIQKYNINRVYDRVKDCVEDCVEDCVWNHVNTRVFNRIQKAI